MITVINNVKKLKEDKNSLIDANAIINEEVESLIKDLTKKIKTINSSHNAKVIINGNVEKFSFNIDSNDEKTIKIIEDIFDVLNFCYLFIHNNYYQFLS
jgi:regulator of replication initiation timing